MSVEFINETETLSNVMKVFKESHSFLQYFSNRIFSVNQLNCARD